MVRSRPSLLPRRPLFHSGTMPAWIGFRLKTLDPSAKIFYLIFDHSKPMGLKAQQMAWDPWPVDIYRMKDDVIFNTANALLRQHNYESLDNFIDRLVLLPASSDSKFDFQGGSPGMWLYSMRSPSRRPVRISLWATPAGKIMIRERNMSISLEKYIASWRDAKEDDSTGFCKHYQFWKSISVDDNLLKTVPEHLRQQIHERWWAVNGFRFLDLPFELREMTLKFAVRAVARPYERRHEHPEIQFNSGPNMKLALVSKQLYQETMTALYHHSTFHFRAQNHLIRFFHYNKVAMMQLRSLELSLDRLALLSLFGVGIEITNRTLRYPLTRPRGGCMFLAIGAKLGSLRRLRINIPHIHTPEAQEVLPTVPKRACQKHYCMAVWAGAREYLRQFPTIEFGGSVWCDIDKFFLAEHAMERKGIIPDPKEFKEWQERMLTEWYV